MDDTNESLGLAAYSTFAERYSTFALTKPHNALYERPATMALLGEVIGLHVLDAGCGPLADILNALSETGWMLDRVVEPKPLDDMKGVDPRLFEELSQAPGFICIRARRVA